MIILQNIINRTYLATVKVQLQDNIGIGISKQGTLFGVSVTFDHDCKKLNSPINIAAELNLQDVINDDNLVKERLDVFFQDLETHLKKLLDEIKTGDLSMEVLEGLGIDG